VPQGQAGDAAYGRAVAPEPPTLVYGQASGPVAPAGFGEQEFGPEPATVPAGQAPDAAPAFAAAAAGDDAWQLSPEIGGPALRGRVLVVEGGHGRGLRRYLPRRAGGPLSTGLSTLLAAISPQILVAADVVDSVHLPSATDPYTALTHIRAAARHPGPLLVHLGGHLVVDRRTGRLNLALRDTRPSALRADALPWSDVAAQLRSRPPEWGTLVIADLTADPKAMPLLRTVPSPLSQGMPLWGAVSSDPDQVGIFTRALVEVLHTGRPGAGAALTPDQIRGQVQSVLRPDTIVVAAYDNSAQVAFRNSARRTVTPSALATEAEAEAAAQATGGAPAACAG
jgi:hypothetical protein